MLNTLSILALNQTSETAPAGPVKGIASDDTTAMWADAMDADLTAEVATSLPLLVSILPTKPQMPMTFGDSWMQMAPKAGDTIPDAPVITPDTAPTPDQIVPELHREQSVSVTPPAEAMRDNSVMPTPLQPAILSSPPTVLPPAVATPNASEVRAAIASQQLQAATAPTLIPSAFRPGMTLADQNAATPVAAILPTTAIKDPAPIPLPVMAPTQQPTDKLNPAVVDLTVGPTNATKAKAPPVSAPDLSTPNTLSPAPTTPISAPSPPERAPITQPSPAAIMQTAPLPIDPTPTSVSAPIDVKPVETPPPPAPVTSVEIRPAAVTNSPPLGLEKATAGQALERLQFRLDHSPKSVESPPVAAEAITAPARTIDVPPTLSPPVAPLPLNALNVPTGIADLPLNSVSEMVHGSVATSPNAPTFAQPNAPLASAPTMMIAQVAQVTPQDRFPLEIALDPPELGRVRMHLHAQDTSVTLVIQADRPETHDLMRRHLEDLTKSLEKQGFTSISLEFSNGQNDPRDADSRPTIDGASDANGDTMQPTDTPQSIAPKTPSLTADSGLNLIL